MSTTSPATLAILAALTERYPTQAEIIEIVAGLVPSAGSFLVELANIREQLRYEGKEEDPPSWERARQLLIGEWAAELVVEVHHWESGREHEPLPRGLSLYEGAVRLPNGQGVTVDRLFRNPEDMNEVAALLWREAEDRATVYVDRKLRVVARIPPPSRSASTPTATRR